MCGCAASLADVKQVDAIAMSLDPVAADSWAAELLSTPPATLDYLGMAEKLKLGRIDYRQLNPREVTVG